MSKYSMKCPVCSHPMDVEAATDEEAMTMMMAMAKEHMTSVHADVPQKSDEEMMQMIKDGWTKSEAGDAMAAPEAGTAM